MLTKQRNLFAVDDSIGAMKSRARYTERDADDVSGSPANLIRFNRFKPVMVLSFA